MPDAPEIAEHKSSKFTLRDMKKRGQKSAAIGNIIKRLA